MITLKEFADRWLGERDLKDSARHEYERILATRLNPLHQLPLNALDAATVRSWYAGMDKTKPTARKHAYGLLSSICSTATTDKRLPENPCRIEGATTIARRVAPVALTPAQLHLLADSITPQHRVLVLLGGWLGLR